MALICGAPIGDLEVGRSVSALERAATSLEAVLSRAHFGDLSSESIQGSLAVLRDFGKSHQTVNHYRAALRAFLRWARDRNRIRDNPLVGVESLNVEEDPRHVRRALTDAELRRLIHSAEFGPIRFEMPGALRAMAYRVAASTGFRVEELRSLAPESFRLDGPDPSIFLGASSTKNRKPADQPIPHALAFELRNWMRGKPRGQSVFPLHHETAKAIRGDLAAAGIPYETDDGVADFHALRAYFISALVRSGASIAEVRKLARHAKPETTLKHYAKVAAHDLRGAVESLPNPLPSDSNEEANALAATGTDGRTNKQTLAPYLLQPTVQSRPDVSHSVLSDCQRPVDGMSLEKKAFREMQTERGGFEPPKPVSQFNGLANRRYRPLSHLS